MRKVRFFVSVYCSIIPFDCFSGMCKTYCKDNTTSRKIQMRSTKYSAVVRSVFILSLQMMCGKVLVTERRVFL
jgi:hypothetical protein